MKPKQNKYLITIGAICTIIPLNILIIKRGITNYILLYLPMIIGYILYFTQYKNYSNKQNKLFKTAFYISIVNIISGIWTEYTSNIHINTFNDIGLDMFIAPLLFNISYFGHRIFSILLCVNVLKDKLSETKIFIIIGFVIVGLIFLPKVCNPYNYSNLKGEKVFGDDYCKGTHYKGEFAREIPWECVLCGHSTDVTNPYENVPIICFGCSISTGRCMECGLLEGNN